MEKNSPLGSLVPVRPDAKWRLTPHPVAYCSQVGVLNVMWLCCPPVAAPWGVQILVMPAGSRDPFTRSPPHSTCCSWSHMGDLPPIWMNWMNKYSTKVFCTFFSSSFTQEFRRNRTTTHWSSSKMIYFSFWLPVFMFCGARVIWYSTAGISKLTDKGQSTKYLEYFFKQCGLCLDWLLYPAIVPGKPP